MHRVFLILLCLTTTSFTSSWPVPWGDGRSRGENLSIKLVTFGQGDDIPSWWGHTALIVEDHEYLCSRIYNFGLFSFDEGMLAKFAMGRLIFSAGDFNVPGYLMQYRQVNREIRIITLNLSPEKKLTLAKKLADSVLPENRDYLYHHYDDNCSTRLRDLLNEAVDGALKNSAAQPARMTLRDHTKRYVSHSPSMELLLMFLMNDSIDKTVLQWDEMFLPDELEAQALKLSYADSAGNKINLAGDQVIVFKASRDPVPPKVPGHTAYMLIFGIFLGGISVIFAWYYSKTNGLAGRVLFGLYQSLIGLIIGLPGLFLALLSLFTDHTVTYHNENLLLSNPVTFLLFIIGLLIIRDNLKAITWFKIIACFQLFTTGLALGLKIFPAFDQDNWLIFAFLIPVWIGCAGSAWWLLPETKRE